MPPPWAMKSSSPPTRASTRATPACATSTWPRRAAASRSHRSRRPAKATAARVCRHRRGPRPARPRPARHLRGQGGRWLRDPTGDGALRRRCLPEFAATAERPDACFLGFPGAGEPAEGQEMSQRKAEGKSPQRQDPVRESKRRQTKQESQSRPEGQPMIARIKKTVLLTLGAILGTAAFVVAPASAAYDLHGFDVAFLNADGTPAVQAGSHPYAMATVFFPTFGEGKAKDVLVEQLTGFVGDGTMPRCSTAEFLAST